jgi:glycosyltransferase involved in cell wall biosynthesis
MRLLITGPALDDPGGVAGYYRNLLPCLEALPGMAAVRYVEIGSTAAQGRMVHIRNDQQRVREAAIDFNPTVVLVNPSLNLKSFLRDGFWVRSLTARGQQVVVFFRGWELPFAARLDRLGGWPFRLLYGRAGRFIVLAEEFRRALHGWLPAAAVVCDTTTVEPRLFGLSRAEPGESGASRVVKLLFMSRLVPGKGADLAIEAVRLLTQQGVEVRLTIAGDGPERPALQGLIDRTGLSERVILAGYLRDAHKQQALSNHDIFLFPSTYGEGMPNAVLEAMAAGMAVVTTPVGGVRDFFDPARMGRLIDEVSAQAIASQVADMLGAPTQLLEISRFNQGYARDHFHPQVVARRIHAQLIAAAQRTSTHGP